MVLQSVRRRSPLPVKETWMKVKDPAMIRRWRMQERFSQRDLALLVRRSQATIHLLESGKMRTLSESLAIDIASRLHVPWPDLFEAEEGEPLTQVTSSLSSSRHAAGESGHQARRISA